MSRLPDLPPSRIHPLMPRSRLVRHLLGWIGLVMVAAMLMAVLLSPTYAADAPASTRAAKAPAAALMLRPGNWSQDVGSYLLPAALGADPGQWPTDGWYRVTHKVDHLHVQAVTRPAQGLPDFLNDIAAQVRQPDTVAVADEAEEVDTHYIRVPGVQLRQGRLPKVSFNNVVLRPELGHTYALTLGTASFTLTVHNGLRNAAGVPYGQGAHLVVSHGNTTSTYLLGEWGWDAVIEAVADLDGDGLPDFMVYVGRNNGADEFLLLSTQARPGRNSPTAVLSAQGC